MRLRSLAFWGFCFFCFSSIPLVFSKEIQNSTLPLVFEQNQGQADSPTRFLARTGTSTILLDDSGAILKASPSQSVRMSLLHSSKVSPIAESATGGFANYYVSPDRRRWLNHIPMFARVRYASVYSGIDAVFHGRNGRLEYDFEIVAGSEPSNIAFEFNGAEQVSVEKGGGLEIRLGTEIWHLLPPVAYQLRGENRDLISAHYQLSRQGVVTFSLGKFDPSRALVIDPVVQYVNFLQPTTAAAMQIDKLGNLLIAGPQTPADGSILVTKLDPTGSTVLYSTMIANADGHVNALAIDSAGDAYIAGITNSSNFPVTSANLGTCTSTFEDCNAGFVVKLDGSGTVVYSTLLASGEVIPRAITVDAGGNAYVAGNVDDMSLQTVNAFEPVSCTCLDAFFAKLNPEGTNFVFASYFYGPPGPNSAISAYGIVLDSSGDIFLSGPTNVDPPLVKPWQWGSGGLFLSEFTPDGKTLLFSTRFGSEGDETLAGMAAGTDGTIYLVGTAGGDFPFSPAYPLGLVWGPPMFAVAIDPTLTKLTYSDYLGAGTPNAIALDASNHLYVAGEWELNLMPLKNPVVSDLVGGGFALELDSTGSPLMVTEFGGKVTQEIPTAMAIDQANNFYLAGAFTDTGTQPLSPDPVLVGSSPPSYTEPPGGGGLFLAKIGGANQPAISLSTPESGLALISPYMLLRNVGSADLHISSIAGGGGISKIWKACSNTIPAGASCYVTASDSNGGFAAGTITIVSDAQPAIQTFTMSLPVGGGFSWAGYPIGNWLWFENPNISFPPQMVGTPTNTAVSTIWNVGGEPGDIDSLQIFGDITQTNNCGTLQGGQSCSIQISGIPAGSSNDEINVSYDGGVTGEPVVGTEGAGLLPMGIFLFNSPQQILLSNSRIEFGSQQVNGIAIPRTVTVTNTADSPLSPPTVSIAGPAQFVVSGNTCTTTIASHQSCVVSVQFIPAVDGELRGDLNIAGSGATGQVQLDATGVIGSVVQVAPLSLNFPSTVGQPGLSELLTLSNTSNSLVDIMGISLSLPDFTETDNCGGQVPASGSCVVTVLFTPHQLGVENGTITIAFGNNVVAQVVPLVGVGQAPLQVTPASLSFGSVPVGTTSAGQFVNLGNGTAGVSPVSYSVAVTGPFAVSSQCPDPMPSLLGCGVTVTFLPPGPGPQQGALTVSYANLPEQTVVSLSGTGVNGPIAAVPSSLSFGNVIVGSPTQLTAAISNSGNMPLAITSYQIGGANGGDFNAKAGQCSSIAAGGNCSLQIDFTPSEAGPRSGVLTLVDNDSGSPQAITLGGAGVLPFTMQAPIGGGSATVASGGTANYQISVSAASGFSGTVQFTCAGAPSNSNCTIQPNSVAFSSQTTSAMLNVQVKTTGTASAVRSVSWTTLFAVALGAPLILCIRSGKPGRTLLLAYLLLALLPSCGGGSSNSATSSNPGGGISAPSTPAGAYSLTVAGVCGVQSQSVTLQLVVQ